jgi:hypothetical protein
MYCASLLSFLVTVTRAHTHLLGHSPNRSPTSKINHALVRPFITPTAELCSVVLSSPGPGIESRHDNRLF